MALVPFEIILAFAVGDGHLCMQRNAKNAYLDVTHICRHDDYMEWKRQILTVMGIGASLNSSYRVVNGVQYKISRLLTRSSEDCTRVWRVLYKDRRKTLSAVYDQISPFVLACWFMDDGSRKLKKRVRRANGDIMVSDCGYIDEFLLATDGFSYDDCLMLCNVLMSYGIAAHIQRTRSRYRISISDKISKRNFKNIVSPYISQVPSMLYKIEGSLSMGEAEFINIGKTEGIKENERYFG